MGSQFGIIVLFVVGMALIVAEMLLPGVIIGVIGVGCVLVSVFLAFHSSSAFGWILTAIGVLSIPVLVLLWIKVINRVFAMKFTQEGYTSAQVQYKELIGQEGVALTMLRPAGSARFGNKKVDVVSDGEVIERDTRIKVVEVKSNRVVVHALKG